MTYTLANMSVYAPTSCRMNKLSSVKLLPLSRTKNRTFCNNVKAMVGDEASLQRAKQQQQLQPKMKGSQASPRGNLRTITHPIFFIPSSDIEFSDTDKDGILFAVLLNQFPVARTLQQMMDTMDRIVENPLVYSGTSPLVVVGDDEYSKGKIPWAIKEGQKDYKMRFNMPGMSKNDVKVWIEENMLVVKAEKVPREQQHEGQANGSEELSPEHEDWPANSYGRYNHRIALPEKIEFEKIMAQVKDGVLYITIPKANTSAKIIGIDVQ